MNNLDEIYRQKYLKYKTKYLELKDNYGGAFAKSKKTLLDEGRYVILFNGSTSDIRDRKTYKNYGKEKIIELIDTLPDIFNLFSDDSYWFKISKPIDNPMEDTTFLLTKNKITDKQFLSKEKGLEISKELDIIYNIWKKGKKSVQGLQEEKFDNKCNELKTLEYYSNIKCDIKNKNYKPDYNNYFIDINYEYNINNSNTANFRVIIKDLISELNKTKKNITDGCILNIKKSDKIYKMTIEKLVKIDQQPEPEPELVPVQVEAEAEA